MPYREQELRAELVAVARKMLAAGLVKGTSGNVSARVGASEQAIVTPSGVDYEALREDDLVSFGLDGSESGRGLKPSVDMPIHAAIYRSRPDAGAVVHTHSPYATAFSVVHLDVPALITESAGYLGGDGAVRVIEYVPPARPDTGERVAAGLGRSRAVLLPNHGVVAVGESLGRAFAAALQVEEAAHVALLALQLGEPKVVPRSEVERMHEFIHHHYGQRRD